MSASKKTPLPDASNALDWGEEQLMIAQQFVHTMLNATSEDVLKKCKVYEVDCDPSLARAQNLSKLPRSPTLDEQKKVKEGMTLGNPVFFDWPFVNPFLKDDGTTLPSPFRAPNPRLTRESKSVEGGGSPSVYEPLFDPNGGTANSKKMVFAMLIAIKRQNAVIQIGENEWNYYIYIVGDDTPFIFVEEILAQDRKKPWAEQQFSWVKLER